MYFFINLFITPSFLFKGYVFLRFIKDVYEVGTPPPCIEECRSHTRLAYFSPFFSLKSHVFELFKLKPVKFSR